MLGGDREGVRHRAQRLNHEQVAQVGGQVAHEPGEVAARVRQALHGQQRAARIVVGQGLGRVEHEAGVGHPEDVHHVLELHLGPP